MIRKTLACWISLIAVAAFSPESHAQTCLVNDPTGTPLNVRARPNGAILGALHNGVAVQVLQVSYDGSGRPWAYIAPVGPGQRGWVFGAYLACGR